MAIIRPTVEEVTELQPEQPVMVDSDAPDNASAILEIERWCRDLGLARVREHWLRTLVADGTKVRRGVCYRPAGDVGEQYAEQISAIDRRVAAMPESGDSVDLKSR